MSADYLNPRADRVLTLPDLVTLAGLGLGIWWAVGGPSWAGVVSVVADEVDGRVARASNAVTNHGSELDWGADVALLPLALLRLGREGDAGVAPLALVPLALLFQSRMRAEGVRPSVGSLRAVVMLAAIALHENRRGG